MGGGINIIVPLDDNGYGEFTNEQIEQIKNYCLQFGESSAVGNLLDGFRLVINSTLIENVYWTRHKGEFVVQGADMEGMEFLIGFGFKYVLFT